MSTRSTLLGSGGSGGGSKWDGGRPSNSCINVVISPATLSYSSNSAVVAPLRNISSRSFDRYSLMTIDARTDSDRAESTDLCGCLRCLRVASGAAAGGEGECSGADVGGAAVCGRIFQYVKEPKSIDCLLGIAWVYGFDRRCDEMVRKSMRIGRPKKGVLTKSHCLCRR